MKLKNFCSLILLFLFLLTTNSNLLAQNSSSFRGTIKDAKTGETLPGANILLVGTSLGAASDKNGGYIVAKVPPGSYTLRVTYIGYKTVERTVNIRLGETSRQDFKLDYVAVKGEEVVITAQAEGQMAAINQQLASRAIMNVVSSARIQELPDANAAESVGRLPGVSVLREGGEGNKIVIRGLSPKYNAVMIDGIRIAATDFNDRSINLSMISPYMLEGIEVMKAITPDQDADIIGGSVNFKMKEAEDGFHHDMIIQGGYNGLKNTYNDYKIVGSVSNRYVKNLLGIFAQIDIDRRNRGSNELGAGYYLKAPELDKNNQVYINSLNLNDLARDKQRLGGTVVLDYRLPAGKIKLKNFFSFANTKKQNRGESLSVESKIHSYSASDIRNKLQVMTNIISFENTFSLMKIDANLAHTYSENNSPRNMTFGFKEYSAFSGVDEKVPPTLLPTYAKNNLADTRLATIEEFDDKARERDVSTAANIEMNVTLSKQISGKIKFGGKYRYKDRKYDHNSAGGQLEQAILQDMRDAILDAFPWMQETVQKGSLNLPFTLFIDRNYDTNNFLNGQYDFGPVADIGLMNEIRHFVLDIGRSRAYKRRDYTSTTNDYFGNEYSGAGYAMADINIGSKIKIIPGFRFERIKTHYTAPRGNSSYPGSQDYYRYRDTTAVQIHDFWLPMVHFRYKPFQWFDVRFAYTNTISKPDFKQIVPRYNITTTSVSWHNYKLKPSLSENYDLYFSIHENRIGLFTVGGFVKRVDDLIYPTKKVILDPAEYDLANITKDLEIETSINNPFRANIWGIELDWQTNFWYLPGFLRGLVLNTNYTHIFSEAKYPRTEIEVNYVFYPRFEVQKNYIYSFYNDRLLNQPDNIINTSVGYDYKGFSIRVSMLYQSDIFKKTSFWPELRSVTDDYWRWDLSVKQNLPWYGLQFFANINNITSALDRDLNLGSLFPAAEQHYGRTMDMGLRWRL